MDGAPSAACLPRPEARSLTNKHRQHPLPANLPMSEAAVLPSCSRRIRKLRPSRGARRLPVSERLVVLLQLDGATGRVDWAVSRRPDGSSSTAMGGATAGFRIECRSAAVATTRKFRPRNNVFPAKAGIQSCALIRALQERTVALLGNRQYPRLRIAISR